MRNAMLAILALSAATVSTVAGSSPAAAYDYPYCIQGRGVGVRTGGLLQCQSARCLRTAAADAGLSGLLIEIRELSPDGRTDARDYALNDPAIRIPVVTTLK